MNICTITLGCPKNIVDSEYLRAWLTGSNFRFTDKPKNADVVIINTCSFILPAREEAVDTILDAVSLKNEGLVKHIYVVGCLPQRYLKALEAEIPEVDRFFPNYDFNEIGRILANDLGRKTTNKKQKRLLETSRHYAYLKISDGCDNRCHFCTIPQIKGRQRSKPLNELLDEATELVDNGVKELILVAQDTTSYGRDLRTKTNLSLLIQALAKIKKLEWIRILYAHPAHVTDDLLELFKTEKKLCRYIDVPVQHISDNVLRAMGRQIVAKKIRNLIEKMRFQIPDLAIRTTLMVGYPGESEDDFQMLKDFVSDVKFDRLGVFKFIPEPGTKAAELSDQIDERLKEERLDELMSLQHDISLERNKKLVGKKIKVIIDESNNNRQSFMGRTQWDSPLIDNTVHVEDAVVIGRFYNVTIDRGEAYDLWGKAK